jgi:hypothetical protein
MHTTIIFNHFFACRLIDHDNKGVDYALNEAKDNTKQLLNDLSMPYESAITPLDEIAMTALSLIGLDKALELVDEIYSNYNVWRGGGV